MTNRKSLSIGTKIGDLERRNSPNLCVISPYSVAFRTDYVKVVLHRYFLRKKCRPKNPVFSDISLMAILAGDHP